MDIAGKVRGGAGGGATIALTVAPISVAYGSPSATSPSMPNQNSCRRLAIPPNRRMQLQNFYAIKQPQT